MSANVMFHLPPAPQQLRAVSIARRLVCDDDMRIKYAFKRWQKANYSTKYVEGAKMLFIVHRFDLVNDLYVCIVVIASDHQFHPHGEKHCVLVLYTIGLWPWSHDYRMLGGFM